MEFDYEILKDIIREKLSTTKGSNCIKNIKFENITYFIKAEERESRYMLIQYRCGWKDTKLIEPLITIKEDEYKLRVKQKERSNKISIIIKHEN